MGGPSNQITKYCNMWFIPKDAQKPVDGRKVRGSVVGNAPVVRKPLPIGVSNYRNACTNYYYVDKTLLIRDFWDERAKVSLFTRPEDSERPWLWICSRPFSD